MMKLFNETKNIPEVIFRAYDVRGVINEALTGDLIYTIAKAIAKEAQIRQQSCLIVARDGRLTSPLFSQAVISGLLESGIDVIDIGSVPTPLMYFATHLLLPNSGVMITGSHNPANYNGLKIILAGNTLADKEIKQLYYHALAGEFPRGNGKLLNVDIVPAYIARVIGDIKLKRRLKVVVDAGNGIAGKIAPDLYSNMGCEVIKLFCEVNGEFPNHHPDPSQAKNLEALIEKVRTVNADIGLAFDGDGDRLGVVTNKGEIIWPDRQLMCFAKEVLKRRKGATILFDVKCTKHLPEMIAQEQGISLMWKTGHSFIKNKMKEVNGLLGGEMSGHIFFKDRWYGFDDALYSGARLLEILSTWQGDSASLFASFPNSYNTPELQIPVAENEKFSLMKKLTEEAAFPAGQINLIDGIRVDYPYGFGLIRPSNTTATLTLRFEADSPKNLKKIQDLFKQQILAINPCLILPF